MRAALAAAARSLAAMAGFALIRPRSEPRPPSPEGEGFHNAKTPASENAGASNLPNIHIHRLRDPLDAAGACVLPYIVLVAEAQRVAVLGDPDVVLADVRKVQRVIEPAGIGVTARAVPRAADRLAEGDGAGRDGSTGGGTLCAGLQARVHLRPDFPRGELQHEDACGGVLDDRAGNLFLRSERPDGYRRGFPQVRGTGSAGQGDAGAGVPSGLCQEQPD